MKPEIVVKRKDPELDGVFCLVLTLVRLNQQVVLLLQKLHTFVLGHHLRSLIENSLCCCSIMIDWTAHRNLEADLENGGISFDSFWH